VEPTCHSLPFLFPSPPTVPPNPTGLPFHAPHPLRLRRPPPISHARHRAAPSTLLPRPPCRCREEPSAMARRLDPSVGEKGDGGPGRRGALSLVCVGLFRGGGGSTTSSSVRTSRGHGGNRRPSPPIGPRRRPLSICDDGCRGLLPPAVDLCRSCVGLEWIARETTGFILVQAFEE
jgi:hypothetical protein